MNFISLEYFKAVAQELNVTHAAQKLYITQQALSAQIRKLEEELQVSLFVRSPRLSLTDAGRCLFEAVNKMDGVKQNFNEQLNEIRQEDRGELRIGLSFTRGQFILPFVLPEYARKNPKVKVKIFEERSNDLLAKLLRGEIDFWVTAEQPNLEGLTCEPLFTEKFFLVVPKSVVIKTYGQAKGSEILKSLIDDVDIDNIRECPFVLLNPGNRSRDLFDIAMRTAHVVPNIILETDNSQTAFSLAQQEMALTVYSDMFLNNYHVNLNPSVLILPFDKYIKSDVLHIYYSSEINGLAKYKKSFLKQIHETYPI